MVLCRYPGAKTWPNEVSGNASATQCGQDFIIILQPFLIPVNNPGWS